MTLENSIKAITDETQRSLALKLCQLPCFSQDKIISIRVINGGLSQTSFHVRNHHKSYFAKFLNSNSIEPLATELAGNYGLSPRLIYAGYNWLITEFIVGKGLEQCHQSTAEKLTILLALVVRCHLIPYTVSSVDIEVEKIALNARQYRIPVLDITEITRQLFRHTILSYSHLTVLESLGELLLKNLATATGNMPDTKPVFCHGDANFSNVMQVENSAKASGDLFQLIDFECARIAPVEYELAMLMAINGIDNGEVTAMIERYQAAFTGLIQAEKPLETAEHSSENLDDATDLSADLVTCYLELSHLINGLWYLSQYGVKGSKKYQALAIAQFKALEINYPQLNLLLDEMR